MSIRNVNCQMINSQSPEITHLIVIDFEATCWDRSIDKLNARNYPEIIEFPAVLLDLSNGQIIKEFRHFVTPMENPQLSSFCTNLTGITQEDVDNGVPITTCLLLFQRWCDQEIKKEWCVSIATWSDWDLGNCLKRECCRKVIIKPAICDKWIDLRACYRNHYKRRSPGLKTCVNELGLTFEGREHSGICDARNAAKLAWKLKQDGFNFRIPSH